MPSSIVTKAREQEDPAQDQDSIINEEDDYDDYEDYLDDELNDADMWDSATGGRGHKKVSP